jgi:hypothetical protein
VREPLNSHGSYCSAVAVTELPMSKEPRMGDAEALLKEWARGSPGAVLTHEAKAALVRLSRRRSLGL